MLAVTALHKPSQDFSFFKTGSYKKLRLCSVSGELATPGCKSTYEDVFRCGIVPTELCPLHKNAKPKASPTPEATPVLELTPAPTPAEPEATPAVVATPEAVTPSPAVPAPEATP